MEKCMGGCGRETFERDFEQGFAGIIVEFCKYRAVFGGATGSDKQKWGRMGVSQQFSKKVRAVSIAPLKVIDHKHDRVVVCDAMEHFAQC